MKKLKNIERVFWIFMAFPIWFSDYLFLRNDKDILEFGSPSFKEFIHFIWKSNPVLGETWKNKNKWFTIIFSGIIYSNIVLIAIYLF